MNNIIKILKGILIGLGSILPGVSGGMIAASFNIYQELIDALNNFIKTPFKAVFKIWQYLVGIAIGIAIGFVLIATVLKLYPLPITMLFIGLIIGSLPNHLKVIKAQRREFKHYLIMIIAALLVLVVLLLKPAQINEMDQLTIYIINIVMGLLIALSLIIPGLSGTMILMAIGIYTYFTETVSNFIKAIFNFNLTEALNNLPNVIIIGFSTFVVLIVLSRIISKVIKNYPLSFNMAILGILIVSPVNILWSLKIENTNIYTGIDFYDILFSIIGLLIGFILIYKLDYVEVANEDQQEQNI